MVEMKNSVVQIKTCQPHFPQKGNVYMELYFIMICFHFLNFNSCHAENFYALISSLHVIILYQHPRKAFGSIGYLRDVVILNCVLAKTIAYFHIV